MFPSSLNRRVSSAASTHSREYSHKPQGLLTKEGVLAYNLPQYSLMALQQSKMGQVTEICYCLLPACEQQQHAKRISTLIERWCVGNK